MPAKLPTLEVPKAPKALYAREHQGYRLPPDLLTQAYELADKLGETRTEFVETAIRERIERLNHEHHNPR